MEQGQHIEDASCFFSLQRSWMEIADFLLSFSNTWRLAGGELGLASLVPYGWQDSRGEPWINKYLQGCRRRPPSLPLRELGERCGPPIVQTPTPVETVLELLCWCRGSCRLCGRRSALSLAFCRQLCSQERAYQPGHLRPSGPGNTCGSVDFPENGNPPPGGQNQAGQGRELRLGGQGRPVGAGSMSNWC